MGGILGFQVEIRGTHWQIQSFCWNIDLSTSCKLIMHLFFSNKLGTGENNFLEFGKKNFMQLLLLTPPPVNKKIVWSPCPQKRIAWYPCSKKKKDCIPTLQKKKITYPQRLHGPHHKKKLQPHNDSCSLPNKKSVENHKIYFLLVHSSISSLKLCTNVMVNTPCGICPCIFFFYIKCRLTIT